VWCGGEQCDILCDCADVVVVVVVVCRSNEIGAEGCAVTAAIATALATNTTLTTCICRALEDA